MITSMYSIGNFILVRSLVLGLFLIGVSAFPSEHLLAQSKSAKKIADEIESILSQVDFSNAFWGIRIIDLKNGEELYGRNAGKSLIPASNLKLYTTAAALDQLGPDFQYATDVFIDGPIQSGILNGNLIVKGSGDPSIGSRFFEGDHESVFRSWAQEILNAGIRHIEGDIIGDDDIFADEPLGPGWSWDDELFYYSAEVGGLVYNENCVDFDIVASTLDSPATIEWFPKTSYVTVLNETRTTARKTSIDEGYYRQREGNDFRISSLVPLGKTDNESLTIYNPSKYFVHVLREVLVSEGIVVSGQAVDVDDLSIKPFYKNETYQKLLTHKSPPLSVIVKQINKDSNNLLAEQVLKSIPIYSTLAHQNNISGPATFRQGVRAAKHSLVKALVDTARIVMVDGSGLSRLNLVTPEMTTELLRFMWNHDNEKVKQAFIDSLPIGGVDGSLKYRYRKGAARKKVKAKTGFVSHARTLSGYVPSKNGKQLAFSLMANHYTIDTREVNNVQDQIINFLAKTRL